jgi:hypothetical protein
MTLPAIGPGPSPLLPFSAVLPCLASASRCDGRPCSKLQSRWSRRRATSLTGRCPGHRLDATIGRRRLFEIFEAAGDPLTPVSVSFWTAATHEVSPARRLSRGAQQRSTSNTQHPTPNIQRSTPNTQAARGAAAPREPRELGQGGSEPVDPRALHNEAEDRGKRNEPNQPNQHALIRVASPPA